MLRPLKSKSIVKTVEKVKETASGIILSSADPMEATRGLVISIGPDVTEFKPGDEILPNWQKARPTKYDGEDYYIVDIDDVVQQAIDFEVFTEGKVQVRHWVDLRTCPDRNVDNIKQRELI